MVELQSIQELISLKGRRSLITGAASGIGKATALRFGEAGSDLELVDINLEGLKTVASEIKSRYGVEVGIHRVDLSKKSEIDKLWEDLSGREPDILVNIAGIYVFKDFLELNEDFLEKIMSVNLYSVLWMCQHMIRRRLERGGVIINVGSIESILPFARNLVHYDVSKIGVLGLTRALAREYGGKGFRVNIVIPGGIETEGVKKLKKEALMKLRTDIIKTGMDFKRRLPMSRMGKPDEVARVILFLASDLASYVNGTAIPVDGGFLSS
ncbi:MAG: SDR family oxidoreductase [Desulfurococcales archaeon]|nr:SDR family oxidoreductase [Desulfurococcales archaeon]